MKKTITVLPGDGIGPEICTEAIKILDKAIKSNGHEFSYIFKDFGGAAIDHYGSPFPFDARQAVSSCDAVLVGTVGGFAQSMNEKRPEDGVLALKSSIGAYAKLYPVKIYDALIDASPISRELCKSTDLLIVREISGGIYFGKHGNAPDGSSAFDTEEYSGAEIQRIAEVAFNQAQNRRKKVCSIDKADALDSSRLWRRCVEAVSKSFPDVELEHMYIDHAVAQLIKCPNQFDVILCPNMFGDILAVEACTVCGAIGTIPSASIGGRVGIFRAKHGPALDIAGKNIANPIGAILSCAMMLHSFGLHNEALSIEHAVEGALNDGILTHDLSASGVTCSEMGDAILQRL